jgi:hypothetical protein
MCLNIANESVTVKDPPNVSYFVKLGPLLSFPVLKRKKGQKYKNSFGGRRGKPPQDPEPRKMCTKEPPELAVTSAGFNIF